MARSLPWSLLAALPLLAARCRNAAAVLIVLAASACASIPPNAGENPTDPLEVYNRHVFEFNERADRYVLRPVAETYVKVVPNGVRSCVSNVFSNLGDVTNAINNLLQGRPTNAVSDMCRVAINSTVGLLGCFDVASKMGLAKNNEDFGQTLGRWGMGPGPYFVLPILGPSTIRDTFGRVVDVYTDPLTYVDQQTLVYSAQALRIVDVRASLLQASQVLEGAALDRYQFVRDAYLQRRSSLISNGESTNDNLPKYEDDPEEEPKKDGGKDGKEATDKAPPAPPVEPAKAPE